MPGRYVWIVLLGTAALAAPRTARAGVELSARLPVGIAVSDATRFELGLRSDLLYVFDSGLGLGLNWEVRSVSLSQRAQEVGATIGWMGDGERISLSPVLDAGYGTQGDRGYAFGRLRCSCGLASAPKVLPTRPLAGSSWARASRSAEAGDSRGS